MRHRVVLTAVFRRFAILSVLPVLLLGVASWARAAVDPAEVGQLLREGRRLELEDRWGEALAHYEKAVRQFPDQASLKRRFDYSRMHYDVRRRYGDASFTGSLEGLSLDDALEVYGEVLQKIQTYYVDAPHWKALVEEGVNNLEVALAERAFLERNAPVELRGNAAAFRQILRRELGRRVVESRQDATDAVRNAAVLGQRMLGLPPAAVVMEFTCGATNSLDAYSAYLTPEQLSEVYSQIEGNFVGLGIELKTDGGRLVILRVIPGSPAEEAGLRNLDQILSVDGRLVADVSTDAAANLLQGEAGSFVELSVVSEGESPRRVRVERRRVDVPSVDGARILDASQGIGYLRLTCFQKTTCRDLDEALWRLHRQGMRGGLIIDLRGNPGGLLASAVEVVDRFLDRGVIVSTSGRSRQEAFTYSAHEPGTWRVPLVLLIDEESASAAEIFAGAIRDHRRGTLVGTRSYGKGSVQGIFPLQLGAAGTTLEANPAGMRLTTAKFYSPNGRPYSEGGVEPDLPVHTAQRTGGGALPPPQEDAALEIALDVARRTAAQRVSIRSR